MDAFFSTPMCNCTEVYKLHKKKHRELTYMYSTEVIDGCCKYCGYAVCYKTNLVGGLSPGVKERRKFEKEKRSQVSNWHKAG